MGLTIPGKLTVQVRNGSRGAFAVGDLATPIGSFKVKDQFLDQFEEGVYEGNFVVTEIYPNAYTYRGSVTTEIRARVVDYQLTNADQKPVAPEPEPDPIDQSRELQKSTFQAPLAPSQNLASIQTSEASNATELFDPDVRHLIASHLPIKLDPTIDRQKFREQRDYLKTMTAYKFNLADQTWYAKSVM